MLVRTDDPDFWREEVCRHVLKVDFDPRPGNTFRASVRPVLEAPGIKIANWSYTAGTMSRNELLAKDGAETLSLLFPMRSTAVVSHRGHEATVKPGQALMLCDWEAGRIQSEATNAFVGVILNRREFGDNLAAATSQAGHRLRDSSATRTLRSFLTLLLTSKEPLAEEVAAANGRYVSELIGLAIREANGNPGQPDVDDFWATRLKMATGFIDRSFRDFNLSQPALAAQQGVSVRYLQKLFKRGGVEFSTYLTSKRLEHARSMIEAGHAANIIDIAMASGFHDVSNFHRMFKRRYGEAPGAMRRRLEGEKTLRDHR